MLELSVYFYSHLFPLQELSQVEKIASFDKKCKKMLCEDGIRFIGIINNMGRQIAGGYKKGIMPLVDDEEHMMGIQHALGYVLITDFDESLGSVEYITAKRKKVIMITIPIKNHIILMSTERNVNSEEIVKKIIDLKFCE
jgi:hypothetical protein